jgi:hypothetical protein
MAPPAVMACPILVLRRIILTIVVPTKKNPFFSIFCDDNHGAWRKWIVSNIGTAAAPPLLVLNTIALDVNVNLHGYLDWCVLGRRSTTSRVLYTSTLTWH